MKQLLLFFLFCSQLVLGQTKRIGFRVKAATVTSTPTTTVPTTQAPAAATVTGEIPYTVNWAYVNDNANQDALQNFFDGNLTDNVELGYNRMRDSAQAVFRFAPPMNVILTDIWLADGQHDNTKNPARYWLRRNDAKHTVDSLGFFDGTVSNSGGWKKIHLAQPVAAWAFFLEWRYPSPTEIKFWGSYTPYQPKPYTMPTMPFEMQAGANAYSWNFQFGSGYGVDPKAMELAKLAHFYRFYFDFELAKVSPGQYAFQPTKQGAWQTDSNLTALKSQGAVTLFCLKNQEGTEEYARMAKQVAIRYGPNANVPDSEVEIFTGTGLQYGRVNQIKKGLNLIAGIQLGNEVNRYWKLQYSATNTIGFQTPYEYAKAVKRAYDAIKSVAPTLPVVLAGLATSTPGYVQAMVEYYELYNNGVICFDAVSYHNYPNEKGIQNAGAGANRGVSPEAGNYGKRIKQYKQMLSEYFPTQEVPVYVTETGYSISTANAENAAYAIGSRTLEQTAGDWIARIALMGARLGLSGTAFYQLYDDSNYMYGPGKYMNWDYSEGLVFRDSAKVDPAIYRRPAGDYLLQMQSVLKGCYFNYSNTDNSVIKDTYICSGNKQVDVIFSPTQTGVTVPYTISTSKAVQKFDFKDRSDNGTYTTLTPVDNAVRITATETPTFIIY